MRIVLALLACVLCCADVCAQPGTDASEKLAGRLESAPSCGAANRLLQREAWGSGADVEFSAIVIRKCEKEFAGKLSAQARANYQLETKLCTLRQSMQQGTMHVSFSALCAADIAATAAAKPFVFDKPLPRASFDCAKARTNMERAICSDVELGQADIVLSRSFRLALKTAAQESGAMRASQRRWLQTVSSTCHLTDHASQQTVSCLRDAFVERFTRLDQCVDEPDTSTAQCISEAGR